MYVKRLKLLSTAVISIFAPIEAVLLTAFVMVIVDFITGIMAANHRKEPVTSSGFRRSVTKIFVYEIALMAAFLVQHYMSGDYVPVEKIVASFIGLTELTSIVENLNEISGGSLFTALIKKLGSKNE